MTRPGPRPLRGDVPRGGRRRSPGRRRLRVAALTALLAWASPLPALGAPALVPEPRAAGGASGVAITAAGRSHANLSYAGLPAAGRTDRRTPTDGTAPYPEFLPATRDDAGLTLRLDSVTPAIATPGKDVVIRLTLTTTSPTAGPVQVSARLGTTPLRSRADLDRSTDVDSLPVVATAAPAAVPGIGGSTQVVVTIPASRITPRTSYGVLPLVLAAHRDGRPSTLATYLPFELVKEYERLALSVAVPLTADPTPDLFATDPATRERAWAAATGPSSRLDRILSGTTVPAAARVPVTYAVDPVLLGPGPAPVGTDPADQPAPGSATRTPTGTTTQAGGTSQTGTPPQSGGPTTSPTTSPTGGPTSTADAPELTAALPGAARTALTARLATLARTHPLWALPLDDPDLSALVDDGRTALAAGTLRRDAAGDLSAALAAADVTAVAWPESAPTAGQRQALTEAYGDRPPRTWLLPLSAAAPGGETGTAARRYSDGTAVAAYDDRLGRLFANAAVAGAGAGLAQRFLAETVTLLQEYPGRSRSVLLLAPRWFDPDPTTLGTLLTAAATTPWLAMTSTTDLLATARGTGAPEVSLASGEAPAPAPFHRGDSPLAEDRLGALGHDLDRLRDLRSVIPAGSLLGADASRGERALLSTRWRGQPAAWGRLQAAVDHRVDDLLGGVDVQASSINFFADSGVLQLTIVNRLDVEVHDVRLVLSPEDRPSRLRVVDAPPSLTIRANSRATVKVQLEAIAAGQATVSAEVTTPGGTRLGTERTTLNVHVQPMNGWVVLGIGGLAGATFLVGLLRTIRRNRPRVSPEELKESQLE